MVTNMEYDNLKLKLYHLELQLKIRNWNCWEEFLLQQLLMEKNLLRVHISSVTKCHAWLEGFKDFIAGEVA